VQVGDEDGLAGHHVYVPAYAQANRGDKASRRLCLVGEGLQDAEDFFWVRYPGLVKGHSTNLHLAKELALGVDLADCDLAPADVHSQDERALALILAWFLS
jgi:hypothetical protein